MMRAAAEDPADAESRKRKGVLPGLIAILHTWDSRTGLPSSRSLRGDGRWPGPEAGKGSSTAAADYLFPVKMMGQGVPGARCWTSSTASGAKQAFPELDEREFRRLMAAARAREWVVYAKKPLGCITYVIEYFARYARRVGIANSRLLAVVDGQGHLPDQGEGRRSPCTRLNSSAGSSSISCPRASTRSATTASMLQQVTGASWSRPAPSWIASAAGRPGAAWPSSPEPRARLRRLEKKARCCPICRRPLNHLPLDASDARVSAGPCRMSATGPTASRYDKGRFLLRGAWVRSVAWPYTVGRPGPAAERGALEGRQLGARVAEPKHTSSAIST